MLVAPSFRPSISPCPTRSMLCGASWVGSCVGTSAHGRRSYSQRRKRAGRDCRTRCPPMSRLQCRRWSWRFVICSVQVAVSASSSRWPSCGTETAGTRLVLSSATTASGSPAVAPDNLAQRLRGHLESGRAGSREYAARLLGRVAGSWKGAKAHSSCSDGDRLRAVVVVSDSNDANARSDDRPAEERAAGRGNREPHPEFSSARSALHRNRENLYPLRSGSPVPTQSADERVAALNVAQNDSS
jgi:hypothetical protein